MVTLDVAILNLVGSLVVAKIQSDTTKAANREKLVDTVNSLNEKVVDAHLQIQTGRKP